MLAGALSLVAALGFFLPLASLSAAPAAQRTTRPAVAKSKSCVWKVSAPDNTGRTLYLAGSVHALRPSDLPLPAAFDVAFQASDRLAFEVAPQDMKRMSERLFTASRLPDGVELKDRVDPRTYAYLLRVLAKTGTAESTIARYQPWYLSLILEGRGQPSGLSTSHGVERYLTKRAESARKPITGLESWRAHADVFAAMSREEAEVMLLLGFIGLDTAGPEFDKAVSNWRRGEAEAIEKMMRQNFKDYPALYRRLVETRNQAWLPRIERWLRDRDTWMVVAGAAHMAGPGGLPELLRARGYRVEQM